jgi:putative hemolysin
MKGRIIVAVGGLVALALAVSGVASGAAAKTDKAAAYCKSKGGVVQMRFPGFGQDAASATAFAGSARFCVFTSSSDGSSISVDLATLYTTKPTLAALAYLQKPPAGESGGSANPASVYCAKLGGAEIPGGGWMSKADSGNPVLQVCVFPDRSMIDSFGLFYHTGGTIRGADLAPILRYKGQSAPPVFTS